MNKRSFKDFFDEHCIIIIPCMVALIVIGVVILFAPYETTYTLFVDGNVYECEDFILNDDHIEIHTKCFSKSFVSHSKYCSFYKIPLVESYSVERYTKSHWNDWFGY